MIKLCLDYTGVQGSGDPGVQGPGVPGVQGSRDPVGNSANGESLQMTPTYTSKFNLYGA